VLLLPLLVIAALAAGALALVAATSRSATHDVERRIREVRRANALAFRLAYLTAEEEREVLAFRLEASAERAGRLAAADREMSDITAEIGRLDLSARGRRLWHDVLAAHAFRSRERQALVTAVQEEDSVAAARAYVRWDLATGRATALVADLSVFTLRRLEHAIADLQRVRARSVELLVGVLGASAAVVLAFSLFVDRYLVRPVRAMTDAARRIASERSALPVPGGHRADELGVLARAMTRTAGDLVRANAELARSISARDDFLSIVSHELKTPLTALKLQLQNGVRRWSGQQDGPAPTWVPAALRQLDRVEALVAELLDLARIRTGRLALNTRPADVAELARGVVERLRDVLARSGNALELDVPERLDLECDPDRIEQVIGNLLANAGQHAPGTRVVLGARRAEDEGAVLWVEDCGPGIPEAARERVFAPYEKVERERRGPGLGLGLHIARQIVEAHGGRIRVAAGATGGARLVVTLPARPARSAAAGSRDGAARAP
jgi:signal transduction histidine kinase